MNSITKFRKRNKINDVSNSNDLLELYKQQYMEYFNNNINKTSYCDKYNNSIKGECILLDVSSVNPESSGDEKYFTTPPNSNIYVGAILNLNFIKDKETWVVTSKENLPIQSHDKFKISPLHHEGTLYKSDLTEEVIDIKMSNNSSDLSKKNFYYSPLNKVDLGDYILVGGLYYMVTGIQNNLDLPYAEVEECNQKMTCKLWDREFPCILKNSSYGSKGEISNVEQFSDFDSRGNITIQKNKFTSMLYEGFRQIFNNSKSDIYTITKIQSVFGCSPYRKGGYYNNIVKYTKYVQEDDFINGIAYNPDLERKETDTKDVQIVYIVGEEKIKINTTEEYIIENADNVVWNLDEESVNNNYATIEYQDGTSCIVKGLKVDTWIGIEARDNNGKLIKSTTVFCCSRK